MAVHCSPNAAQTIHKCKPTTKSASYTKCRFRHFDQEFNSLSFVYFIATSTAWICLLCVNWNWNKCLYDQFKNAQTNANNQSVCVYSFETQKMQSNFNICKLWGRAKKNYIKKIYFGGCRYTAFDHFETH